MERWFGYWILVTIRFCELSFKFRQLLLFIWEATSNTSQKGSELEPNCILQLFLGWLLGLCQSPIGQFFSLSRPTPQQNVYACAMLSISGLFFSHTFKSDQSLPHALGFILCAACGSVVLLHAARVFDYFVFIEIAFMDNQAQITETISRLDSERVRW